MEKYKDILNKLARDRNITVEELKGIISERIKAGLNDPDPVKRTQWERIPHSGDMPTPEEWLKYAVEKLRSEGRDDFLREYL